MTRIIPSSIQRNGASDTPNYSRQPGLASMPGYDAGTSFTEMVEEKLHE
jgi:hypothetical protein